MRLSVMLKVNQTERTNRLQVEEELKVKERETNHHQG